MRFHCLSLPHTQSTVDYISCAYTAKARNFCTMMKSLGHEVFLYASEDNDADVDELITIAPKVDQRRWFGDFDYHSNFYPITWEVNDEHWVVTNARAVKEIKKRSEPGDFVCLIAGVCQKAVADALPMLPVVEYGIGYDGVFADYKVFESYSHMHHVYGLMGNHDGKFYDCVVPNYFNPKDFTFKGADEKEDYYVFLGRFISRKGVEVAVRATEMLGAKLIMAGQGCRQEGNKFYGDDLMVQGDHLEHIGHVNVEERAALLSGAKACFMPTTYIEPFGGVSIEALFCGTPVIASDFGAFTETIPHGVAGYRFRTVGEAAHFASDEMLAKLDNARIAKYAEDNFSMWNIRNRYNDYFEQVAGLWGGGYDFNADWHGSDDRYTRWLT